VTVVAQNHPLAPLPGPYNADAALDRFLTVMGERGLSLYPEQEEAILELFAGKNVVLNTPTGSGKSLVAAALHFRALCAGERSVYTCPIKALVNEKFLSLCRDFGPDNVGMMTGDASVNPQAKVLCCTAEILANIALHRGHQSDIRAVIMDEFHYYSDRERGYAWQVPLLTMRGARFLLMSATLSATTFFEEEMTRLTGVESVTVRGDRRPVPLEFEYSETPLAEKVQALLDGQRAPIYLVYFTQRSASEAAQDLMSLNICTRDERAALGAELERFKFNSPYGKEMKRWLRHGIGVHHAGLLPKYRVLVEQLAQRGLLKVICGTDTLGVGINVPIRTVLFTQLWKYDGQKSAILSVRDFRQISGRAGRRGYDNVGYVVVQAPEHMIANKRAEEKAAGDPKKQKKLVKERPPEGFVGWDQKTLERLRTAPAEVLTSHFDVSHGMLLQVLARDGDGCRAMKAIIAACHETAPRKTYLRKKTWQLFRSLIERKIVEFVPPLPNGRKLRVNVELQDDFSLHQTLSLWLLDTLPLLDRASPTYAADVLTLCEAIVEDPDAILRQQVSKLKGQLVAELKAAGVEYDERMEKLEQVEYPKPLREFVYETFNRFAAAHPWVEGENIRPKSIAREMFERYQSFAEYVREYGLERMEGLLLRHLSQTWKVLSQTVPESCKTEEVLEMETYFRELIRGVDSSLLEEWEKLRNPDYVAAETGDKPARPSSYDLTRDVPAFRRQIRAAIFGFLQDVNGRDWEAAAERLSDDGGQTTEGGGPETAPLPGSLSDSVESAKRAEVRKLEALFAPYFEARGRFRLDPAGRAIGHTHWVEENSATGEWTVAQVLVDAEEQNDWELVFTVPLAEARAAQSVVLRLVTLQPVGAY
jgi:superfamily II RNA helicase